MKGFRAVLAVCLLSSALCFADDEPEVFALSEHYPRSQAVNVVFVADGYTEALYQDFRTDAAAFRDAFLRDSSLAAYANYFNYYGIFTASAEPCAAAENIENDAQCADASVVKTSCNSAWGASYCQSNIQRLLFVPNPSAVQRYVRARIPEADIIVVVVNSTRYGGGGGAIAVANRTNPQIVVHETGHSFVGLADEYDTDYPGYVTRISVNITSNNTRETVHWNHWIDDSTPVPTPTDDAWRNVVGVFEGAGYRTTGWYRPKYTCRMRSNSADFCPVCAEAWVLKLYSKVSPLVSASPDPASVVHVAQGEPVRLADETRVPADDSRTVRVRWKVDGRIFRGASGPTFERSLGLGKHIVRAIVLDTTLLVRKDENGLLRDEASWTVVVGIGTSIDAGPDARPAVVAELGVGAVTRQGVRLAVPRSGLHRVELFGADGRRIGDLGWHDFSAGEQFLQWPGNGLSAGNVLVRVTRAADRATVEKRVAVE